MVSIIYICINQSINVFYLLIPSQVDDTLKYFQMGPQQAADKW